MTNMFEVLNFEELHPIPVGGNYHSGIEYKYVMATRIDINNDINGEFSLEWIDNLPTYYRVQIGNTFYQKRPSEFIYDYLNESYDYANGDADEEGRPLNEIIYDEVWIYREFF